MSTTLTNGLKLPDKGSVDWYADMQSNYTILDGAVGTVAEHTTALSGKAADSDVVHKTGDETIAGGKTFASNIIIQGGKKVVCNIDNAFIELNGGTTWGKGGSIVLSGQDRSNYANSILIVTKSDTDNFQIQYQNGSLKPVQGDNSLGTSSNQWKSVYAQSYYYNGAEFQNKFVTLDSVQTISGEKTFSKSVAVSVGSSTDSGYTVIANVSRKDVGDGKYYGTYIYAGVNTGLGVLGVYGYIRNTDGTSELQMRLITSKSDGSYTLKALQFQADRYGNTWQFIPNANNAINLGTSSNKWKTLNGINPGALSLPDYTHYEPINFSQWNTSGALTNTYTPTEDGWLYVNIKDTATNSIYIYAKSIPGTQTYSVSVYGNGSQGLAGRLATIIPVIKGLTYGVVIKAASVNDIYAVTFFPALGNV